uniref:Uncharacterized protein n=1 Tax=Moniliophthora roreri TaxID=221103 RepID=A0A0W0FPA1_MONRR
MPLLSGYGWRRLLNATEQALIFRLRTEAQKVPWTIWTLATVYTAVKEEQLRCAEVFEEASYRYHILINIGKHRQERKP